MSGKSRHGKGKSPQPSKKKRSIRRGQQAVTQQPKAQPQALKPVVETQVAAPEPAMPVAAAVETRPAAVTTATASYPNLLFELRRIGVLTAIMLVALIVLVLIIG